MEKSTMMTVWDALFLIVMVGGGAGFMLLAVFATNIYGVIICLALALVHVNVTYRAHYHFMKEIEGGDG